jgi:hypothetical protein
LATAALEDKRSQAAAVAIEHAKEAAEVVPAGEGSASGGVPSTAADAFGVSDLVSDHEKATAKATFDPGPSSAELAELGDILKGRRDRRHQGRGMSPWAYALIAFSGCFGAVTAWKLFDRPALPATTIGSAATASTAALPDDTAPDADDDASDDDATSDDPPDVAEALPTVRGPMPSGGRLPTAASVKSAATAEASAKPKAHDPDDPFGPALDGPSNRGSGSGEESSGPGLSTGQVSAVVGRNRRGVSRRCLALVRAAGQTAAKVNVSLTIGSSGAVQSIGSSGGKNVPGLASCVASRVRNWRFPSASGTTRVSVPFAFIAQ